MAQKGQKDSTVFYIFLHKDTIYHKTCNDAVCPKKGQKGVKVGIGAVRQNQLFCILLKIGSLDFFDILHKVRGH